MVISRVSPGNKRNVVIAVIRGQNAQAILVVDQRELVFERG